MEKPKVLIKMKMKIKIHGVFHSYKQGNHEKKKNFVSENSYFV